MQLNHELQDKIDNIVQVQVDEVSDRLDGLLKEIRTVLVAEAKSLGRGGSNEDYERFEAGMSYYHHDLGWDLRQLGLLELSCRCYQDLDSVLIECRQITGFNFNRSKALFDIGLLLLEMKNQDGASYLELASIADADIARASAAAFVLDKMMNVAWSSCDLNAKLAGLALTPLKDLATKLNEAEKYRLLVIVMKSQPPQDNRGIIVKESMERAVNSIGKLTEAHLKRVTHHTGELVQQLCQAFHATRYPWRSDFQTWLNTVGTSYASPSDDQKIIDILNDHVSPYESKIFKLLCLTRNFTSHVVNDSSTLFDTANYKAISEMCLNAFLYTLNEIP